MTKRQLVIISVLIALAMSFGADMYVRGDQLTAGGGSALQAQRRSLPLFGGESGGSAETSNGGSSGAGGGGISFDNPFGSKTLEEVIEGLSDKLVLIAVPIAVIMIIIAGVLYLTAAGDSKKVQTANRMLLWAVIGLAVVLIGKGFIALIYDILDLAR